jgi:hypothetical protein
VVGAAVGAGVVAGGPAVVAGGAAVVAGGAVDSGGAAVVVSGTVVGVAGGLGKMRGKEVIGLVGMALDGTLSVSSGSVGGQYVVVVSAMGESVGHAEVVTGSIVVTALLVVPSSIVVGLV